jgi:hypothetical protein
MNGPDDPVATGGRGRTAGNSATSDLRRLGRDGALVTVRWTCRRPDGSVIWEFPDSYLLAVEQAGGGSSGTWSTNEIPAGRAGQRPATAYSCHSLSTPLSRWLPRSAR